MGKRQCVVHTLYDQAGGTRGLCGESRRVEEYNRQRKQPSNKIVKMGINSEEQSN